MKMKKIINLTLSKIILLNIILFFASCKEDSKKIHENQNDSIILHNEEKELVDSITNIINKRRFERYTGKIFGGIKFGINRSTYNQALKEYFKNFENRIYITKKNNEVEYISISSFTPTFYKNRLYKLDILIENSNAYTKLESLFKTKYGLTLNSLWEFKNIVIELDLVSNQEHNGMKEAGYSSSNNTKILYYETDARGPGAPLTQEYAFTHIIYTDTEIEHLVNQEQIRKDSLEQIREIKLIEQNKKKAIKQVENI
ncbi:MAG TPA: hypothetical protein PKG88_07005 [Bacteroidales bacterium]|nr:hypothetical protein [Bacteroidales bacterium]